MRNDMLKLMIENGIKIVEADDGTWYVMDREGHNALYDENFATEKEAQEGYEVYLVENGHLLPSYQKMEIVVQGQRYALPEGFTLRKTFPVGEEIYDETGRACILYDSGYTSAVGDDQPYITTSAQTGKRRIPLQKVNGLGK